jgi:predicted component of type VI protein secretion system
MSLILTVITPANGPETDYLRMAFDSSGGLIGRGPKNDWILPDPKRYLSVCHARVQKDGTSWFIEDLSTNGVYLNDSRQPLSILPPRALTDGDRVRMGGYKMAVAIMDQAIPPMSAQPAAETTLAVVVDDEAASVEPVINDDQRADESVASDVELADEPNTSSTTEQAILVAPTAVNRRGYSRPLPGTGGEIDAFCKGMGIDVPELPPQSYCQALYVAGLLLREALVGARELQQTQTRILAEQGLQPLASELRFEPLAGLAVDGLMQHVMNVGRDQALEVPHFLREVFGNARRHDLALYEATRAAMAEFLKRLDPERLTGNGTPQERFRNLTDMPNGTMPVLFTEALAQAFAAAANSRT